MDVRVQTTVREQVPRGLVCRAGVCLVAGGDPMGSGRCRGVVHGHMGNSSVTAALSWQLVKHPEPVYAQESSALLLLYRVTAEHAACKGALSQTGPGDCAAATWVAVSQRAL